MVPVLIVHCLGGTLYGEYLITNEAPGLPARTIPPTTFNLALALLPDLKKKRDISVLVFFRLMNVLDSTFRDEHFGIDNPEIREHYVHELGCTRIQSGLDVG